MAFFAKIGDKILKFTWNLKEIQIVKTILKIRKNLEFLLTFPDFRTYYKATLVKTVQHSHKDKHLDKQNKLENP
jgi:hypothetical protein